MTTGRLYDIQGFSVQDGPGIRTTAFLKGCPLRCPWCHSPESQAFYKQLSWMSMRCLGLDACRNRCMDACPWNRPLKGWPEFNVNQELLEKDPERIFSIFARNRK